MSQIDLAKLREARAQLSPEKQAEVDRLLAEYEALVEANPLQGLRKSPKQIPFFASRTRTTAAIAGNQFGKTTALVVRSLIECLPRELLPKWMLPFKRFDGAVQGRLVCPSYSLVEQNLVPTFREWTPRAGFRQGFDKGWSSQNKVLSFGNGSTIDFLTYETDLDKFGGVRRHFVGYDEPPPRALRDEGLRAIMRYGGFEMLAFTPLKANTGWLRREILKKRESPDVTVVRGSIHDNVALDPEAKRYFLESLPNDLWRRAREFGDFVDVGGLIYPDFERCVLDYELEPAFVQTLDVVVGVDDGIRNAGFAFVGFDDENVAWVFDEGLLQAQTPRAYAELIRGKLKRWGLREDHVEFVIDPAARQRSKTHAETVMSLMAEEGIYCTPGQNDRDAGFSQLQQRMAYGRFHVDPRCIGLRDESDDYAAEEPGEGKDDSHLVPIKGNDHRLDALRYVCMERIYDPVFEDQATERNLGWEPGVATPGRLLVPRAAGGPPLGSMM